MLYLSLTSQMAVQEANALVLIPNPIGYTHALKGILNLLESLHVRQED